MSRSWIHASHRACSATARSGTWPGGASAIVDQPSSSRLGDRVGDRLVRLDEPVEHLRRRLRSNGLDQLDGCRHRIERGEEASRFASERGPDGEGPELVDADEVGDHVLHRPPLASARGRPLLIVELAEERCEPPPLSHQRHRGIAERQVELEEQGLVVPRRQQHRVEGSWVRLPSRSELAAYPVLSASDCRSRHLAQTGRGVCRGWAAS